MRAADRIAPVLRPLRRQGKLVAGAVALLAGSAVFAGCGSNADTERGRQLFIQNCGTCHKLAQAGTSAQVGPDLDAAFAQARADGDNADSTIEGVVKGQIANPRAVEPGVPDYGRVYMPADLVTGQDAEDVAAYVGSVAGVPGAAPPPLGTPDQVFAEKCSSCHTLTPGAPAGTGPNLADALQGKDAAYIHESIIDPNKVISEGFQPGIMPQDFAQQIPEKNLNELVNYILDQVNKGGG
jgi:mono/diheme cytochrome c family protein